MNGLQVVISRFDNVGKITEMRDVASVTSLLYIKESFCRITKIHFMIMALDY